MKHLSRLIHSHKSGRPMADLVAEINARAGQPIISAPTLYSYARGHRSAEPAQVGILARHMAETPHERAAILAAYVEDLLDDTGIPPSERHIRITHLLDDLADLGSVVQGAGTPYRAPGPDRDADLAALRDHWHADADLRELLHHLANLIRR